jgi:hypothetical protein
MMKKLIAVGCILTMLFSCKSTNFSPKNYSESQLIVGNGGGVSGMIREYCLLDNGQLFTSKGVSGQWKAMRKLKKTQTREIFNKVTNLGLSTLKFDHPGNMTYYFIIKKPPRSNQIRWGESGVSTPEGIKTFYDYLMTIF